MNVGWRVFRYSREWYGTCAFRYNRGGYRRCDIGLEHRSERK